MFRALPFLSILTAVLLVAGFGISAVYAQGAQVGNAPPKAHAGDDQVVSPGSLVTLNGSLSKDPEATQLSYWWRQIDGPSVSLDAPRSVTPSFTSGKGGEVYIFTLSVRDGGGAIGTDTMVVAIQQAAANPLAAQAFSPPSPGLFSSSLATLRRSVQLINIFLFVLAFVAALLTVLDRFQRFANSSSKTLSFAQLIGRRFRRGSWLVLISGALVNSALLFWVVGWQYFILGAAYVVFLVAKVLLEVRLRPSHGLVRDAITHVPVDLAVVRLYDEASGRLVLTRATDDHGRFFALPPAGTYRVEVLKQGYAPFIKEHVVVSGAPDSAVYVNAMLVPSVPQGLAPANPAPPSFAAQPRAAGYSAPAPRIPTSQW